MRIRTIIVALLAIVGSLSLQAQTDPTTQPLVQPGSVTYVGKFTVPPDDGGGVYGLEWSGGVVGSAGPGRLFYECHYGGNDNPALQQQAALGIVEAPALGGVAKVVQKCVRMPNPESMGSDLSPRFIGGAGMLPSGNFLCVGGYIYYDGGGAQSKTHWCGTSLTSMGQPINIQAQNVMLTNSNGVSYRPKAGMMAGWTGTIAPEWRALLGGDSYTGQCCIAIVSRSSYGPSVSAFNVADTGKATVPATMLLGFPDEHQNLGPWSGPIAPYYSGADTPMGTMFPVPNTRTWLSVGRHGLGLPEMKGMNCYGPGTSDITLIGKSDGQGNVFCYDPSNSNKGPHAWRYIFQIMAWDAKDFAAVKAGTKQPWDVRPYAVWDAGVGTPLGIPGIVITGGAYDPSTGRLYVSTGWTDVYVFDVKTGTPPPTDRDCVETAGAWDNWTPNADGRTESRRRTWTQTSPKVGNGKACVWTANGSPAIETETRDIVTVDECAANPVVVTQVAWPGSIEGRRSGSLVWSVANIVSSLKSILWSYGPQSVTVTDSRNCKATVNR